MLKFNCQYDVVGECLVNFSVVVVQYQQSQLKEEGFVLAHGLRVQSILVGESMAAVM